VSRLRTCTGDVGSGVMIEPSPPSPDGFMEPAPISRSGSEQYTAARSSCVVDLPPADTKRWVARRKAAVIAGLRAGAITTEQAYQRYALSEEELLGWQHAFEADGMRGLRVTRLRGQRRLSAQHNEPC
jgi:hypothetical protein